MTSDGSAPRWSRDGQELFYLDLDGWVVTAAVRANASGIEFGLLERLFKPALHGTMTAVYSPDVDARGRFFTYRIGEETNLFANTLAVMVNWPKSLSAPGTASR